MKKELDERNKKDEEFREAIKRFKEKSEAFKKEWRESEKEWNESEEKYNEMFSMNLDGSLNENKIFSMDVCINLFSWLFSITISQFPQYYVVNDIGKTLVFLHTLVVGAEYVIRDL